MYTVIVLLKLMMRMTQMTVKLAFFILTYLCFLINIRITIHVHREVDDIHIVIFAQSFPRQNQKMKMKKKAMMIP